MTRLILTAAALFVLTATSHAAPKGAPLSHALEGADRALKMADRAVSRLDAEQRLRPEHSLVGADRALRTAARGVARLRALQADAQPQQLAAR